MRSLVTLVLFLSGVLTMFGQITQVTLTMKPAAVGDPVNAIATLNGMEWNISNSLSLDESSLYTVTLSLHDQQAGFLTRAEEIQFYFDPEFGLFDHSLRYLDEDMNALPVGFEMEATTACVNEDLSGSLSVTLVDFGSNKSVGSTIGDGETIFRIDWPVQVLLDPDAPPCENEEEIITDVILTWTSELDTVVARAQDPDGEGPLDLVILDDIALLENTTYQLNITVFNNIEGEDLTEEIEAEGDEHMFFFQFNIGIFNNPEGDGNLDNRSDPVNYIDMDEDGLPIGLMTTWTTDSAMENGRFRLILKHQPGQKSGSSNVEDGSTDIDLTFDIKSLVTSTADLILRQGLDIYPNPVTNELFWTIENPILKGKEQIKILDFFRQPVLQSELGLNSLDVGSLSSGIYFLQVSDGSSVWVKRFIKI